MSLNIPLKKVGNFQLPILGLGTWSMGGETIRNPSNNDQRDIKAIQEAINLGFTHIDTAESYANGYTEKLIAKAIKDVDRDKLFITSKVAPHNLGYDDVIQACKGSLKRLVIKRLDLYLIHGPNERFPLKDTMRAMDYLLENELTRYLGVSNFHVPLIQEAQSHTKYQIVNNQIHFNLAARAFELNGTLEYCEKNNILITAYRPIAKADPKFLGNEILQKIANKNKKTPIQVALNWIISKPNVVTLVKSSSKEHLQEDLGALGWQLNQVDKNELDEKFPQDETMFVP